MKSTELTSNRRILIVDDNASIHADFRSILCPDQSGNDAVHEMEAVLFDDAEAPREEVSF